MVEEWENTNSKDDDVKVSLFWGKSYLLWNLKYYFHIYFNLVPSLTLGS